MLHYVALGEFIYALPPLNGKRVVDVGAGTGRSALAVSQAYPSIDLTLIEPDEGRLQRAREKLPKAESPFCIHNIHIILYIYTKRRSVLI